MKAQEIKGWSRLRALLSLVFVAPNNSPAATQGLFHISSAAVRRLGERHRAQCLTALLNQKRDKAVEPPLTPVGSSATTV